jgi:putative ABC transport system permease protein
MLRTFDGLALRQLRTRPLRSVLTAFGVVLGVGMLFGVLLLVGTIRGTFDNLIDSAFGKQEVIVMAKAGTLPDRTVNTVRQTPGVTKVGSMIGAVFNRLEPNGKTVKGLKGQLMVAGIDPYGTSPYRMHLVAGQKPIFGPITAVEQKWAKDAGLRIGDFVRVATPSGPVRLRIVGTFAFENGVTFGGQGYGVVPLREARTIMEMPHGWLQLTAAVAHPQDVTPVQQRLQRALGPGFDVKTPSGWGSQIADQLSALNMILYFFSGIALFVGAFLIMNSFNMTVLQRTREIGMLRTLGASRRMVLRTVLVEALVIGAVGTVFGLLLGLGLAQGLMAMMRGLGMPIGSLRIDAGSAIVASVVGMVVTAFGAYWPARRAARIAPVQAALGGAQTDRRPSARRALIGVALFIPGLVLGGKLFMGGSGSADGLAAMGLTLVMFVGIVMAAPFLIMPVIAALAPVFNKLFPASGRLSTDAIRGNAARTAATAIALTIGLSVVVVNSSMSSSFVGTIRNQLTASFARDFNVQAAGYSLEQGGGPGVPSRLVAAVKAMPETGVATPLRVQLATLPKTNQPGVMLGVDPKLYPQVDKTTFAGVSRASAYRELAAGGVILGANYAGKAGLKRGDTFVLNGPGGTVRAPVVGITQSLAPTDVQLSLATMRSVYGVTADAQLAVKARSAAQAPALERRVRALMAKAYPNLETVSLAGRRAEVNKEISTQFNFFNAIVVIAVLVSLLGVVNTLAMSVMERTREIGVLRALGASRWLVRETMLDESVMITLGGAIAGIAVGLLIGFVWVSSMGSFMPGIAFHAPWGTLVAVAIAAVVAGVIAAALPARRAARLRPVEALTYE